MKLRNPMCFAALLICTAPVHASCDTDYSLKAEFRRSAFVGLVRVKGVTWLDEQRKPTRLRKPLMLGSIPGGFDPYSGAKYHVRNVKTFKGRLPSNFDIFSENTEARTPMSIHGSYLVFLYRADSSDESRRTGDLMIDYCGNSAPVDRAPARIAAVRRLTERRSRVR